MLSYLSSLPISVLRSLDTEANKFYDRANRLYDATLLTRSSAECYNVLCPLFKKNEYYIPLELESNVLSP